MPNEGESEIFVNADLIAAGLSPFNPDLEAISAGRLLIEQIERYVKEKVTFAFESTLSGKGHVERIKKMKQEGYLINIAFIYLDIEITLERISDRVAKGGHHIPETDARRRHPRSVSNFLNLYMPLADEWLITDNSQEKIREVAQNKGNELKIFDEVLYSKLLSYGKGKQ